VLEESQKSRAYVPPPDLDDDPDTVEPVPSKPVRGRGSRGGQRGRGRGGRASRGARAKSESHSPVSV